eukprot:Selendium_serpulae@DN6380_c5_g1_i1.p1
MNEKDALYVSVAHSVVRNGVNCFGVKECLELNWVLLELANACCKSSRELNWLLQCYAGLTMVVRGAHMSASSSHNKTIGGQQRFLKEIKNRSQRSLLRVRTRET